MTDFGIKELYSVTLKPTLDMKINGVFYQKDEPIISFDRIQVAYLQENKRRVNAHGGYGDRALVFWDETRSMGMSFTEGVISKIGLNMISNSKLLQHQTRNILIPYSEQLQSEEIEIGGINYYKLYTKYEVEDNLFVMRNGARFKQFQLQEDKRTIYVARGDNEEDALYYVYYDYEYSDEFDILTIGERAVKGFLKLTGRARVKDDQTGKESTVLIEIPKLKLTSDLTMRLGSGVTPYIYNFEVMGYPVGERGAEYVCEYTFLNEDIDADF